MKTLSSILLFAALLQLAVMVASEKVFTAKPMSSKLLKNTYQLKRLEHSQLTMHSRRVAALGDTISLGGNFQTMGLFYATIELGTPAQPLDVQLDSGSSDLLVFGKTCANCQGNETFNTQATSTLHVVPCEASGYTCHDCAQFNGENACSFSDYYGDGSGVNGSVVTDYLTVGSYNNVNVSFGYISSSTPGFENPPVDGIWGISYPDLAITTPAIQTLIQQYGLYNGFSMCLSLDSPTFSIGAPSTPASAFKFTPITQEEYYNVQITDVEVEGNSLGMSNISQAMSIVDSGTTLMLLPQYIMDGMYSSFLSMCSSTHLEGVCGLSQSQSIFNGQTCFTMSQAQQNAYPTVSVKLEGIHQPLNVPSSAYLFPQGNQFCMGIQSTGSQNMAILGDVFMTNFNVFFDLSKSRIGFAVPQTCPSSSMAKETVTFN